MSSLAHATLGPNLRGDTLMAVVDERMAELIHVVPAGSEEVMEERSEPTLAAAYHLSSGGRRVRARLALSAGAALGLPTEDSVAIASCVELIHNASLIHDDLQDREGSRRGVETVHLAYGDEVAVCTGDLLLSASFAALARFTDTGLLPELFALVHSRIALVIGGQCARLVSTGDEERDMAKYESIAATKSGALLSLPLELALTGSAKGMWSAGARLAANHFAIGYQIADDLEDVEQDRGSLSVNALLVLAAAIGCSEQEAALRARSYALAHLNKSIALAGSLPNASGGLLRELALDLSHRLEETR